MKGWTHVVAMVVALVCAVAFTACDDRAAGVEGPAPPERVVLTPSERREVRTHIEPSLKEIDIELERLSDELDSNGKKAFAEAHRRDLETLRGRIGRLRVQMEAHRPRESKAYGRMREETTARLKRYIDRLDALQEKVGAGPKPPSAGEDEPDAGQGA